MNVVRLRRVNVVDHKAQCAGVAAVEGEREAGRSDETVFCIYYRPELLYLIL